MNLKLYSSKNCNKCQVLNKILLKNNISFEYIDVNIDIDALDFLQKNNIFSLPVVTENGVIISDFNEMLKKYNKGA